jgi:hypothetical protein
MRTKIGWAVAALGLLCALLGLTIMVVLGPDSRRSTGPHPIDTDGIAVVTAPKVISWADVQVDILAEVPVKKPIFVGVGNAVDVENFVGKTQRLEVTRFTTPWNVRTREVDGTPNLPGAPTAFDWWIADSAGLGGASISTTLPDQTVSVAILSVGSSNLSGLEVTMAYGVKGGFAKGIGLLLVGTSGLWFGRVLRRGEDVWDEEDDEDVVYVYVDEDGVEHEISAEEAEDYEIVEEVLVEEDEDVPVDEDAEVPVEEGEEEPAEDEVEIPEEREDVAPAMKPPRPAGILTAAEIAAAVGPEAERDAEDAPDPAGEPDSASPERVVYVYVDENGVEHEVSEEELGDFEVVDDTHEEDEES